MPDKAAMSSEGAMSYPGKWHHAPFRRDRCSPGIPVLTQLCCYQDQAGVSAQLGAEEGNLHQHKGLSQDSA